MNTTQAADELLLYVIHGTLHLVGYEDKEVSDQQRMRAAEREVLARFGLQPHDEQDCGEKETVTSYFTARSQSDSPKSNGGSQL